MVRNADAKDTITVAAISTGDPANDSGLHFKFGYYWLKEMETFGLTVK